MGDTLVIRSRQHPLLIVMMWGSLGALGVALIAMDGLWFDKLQAWSVGAVSFSAVFLWGWRSTFEIDSNEIVVRGFLRRTIRIERSTAASARVRWGGQIVIKDVNGRTLAKVNPNRWGVAAVQLNEAIGMINGEQ